MNMTSPKLPCDISVVIPIYNEEERISHALEDVLGYLQSLPWSWEILLVDDGSRDATVPLLRKWASREPRIRVLQLDRNQGKGAAVRAGASAAAGKYVLFLDADTSVPCKEFDRFLPFLRDGADVIIASRRVPGARVLRHQPLLRKWAGKCFTWICRILLVYEVQDYTCGFKCFSSRASREIFSRQRISRWAFDAEILFLAKKLGFSIIQVPISWSDSAGTKVRIWLDASRSFFEIAKILAYSFQGKYRT